MIDSISQIWKSTLNTQQSLEDLKVDAAKKELLTAIAEREARVAQELAIAERIGTAIEVSIEEFYDYKGDGAATASLDGTKGSFGVSASSQRVSKRIYTFKGLTARTSDGGADGAG